MTDTTPNRYTDPRYTMVVAHPFVIRISYHAGLPNHIFCDKERAGRLITQIPMAINQGVRMFEITPDEVISIEGVSKVERIEKPADMPDWKWLS